MVDDVGQRPVALHVGEVGRMGEQVSLQKGRQRIVDNLGLAHGGVGNDDGRCLNQHTRLALATVDKRLGEKDARNVGFHTQKRLNVRRLP